MKESIQDFALNLLIAFVAGVAVALIVLTIGGWFYTVVRIGQWAIESTNLFFGIALGAGYAITTLFLGGFLGVSASEYIKANHLK